MLLGKVRQVIGRKFSLRTRTAQRNMCSSEKKVFGRQPSSRELNKAPKTSERNFTLPENGTGIVTYHNGIEVHTKDQKPMNFHWVWLRDHCQCPKCLSSSGQKLYRIEDFRPPVNRAGVVSQNHEAIKVTWYDGHESVYSRAWLHEHSYEPAALQKILDEGVTLAWDRQIMESGGGIPHFAYEDVLANEETLHGWLSELDMLGLTILTGAPTERGAVTKLCNLVGYPRNTMYGLNWDVESIPNPNNLAYTSLPLPLHADLCYYESPPGVQMLHCIKFDQKTGGENTFVDAIKVAEDLKEVDADSFRTLCTVLTTFHKYDADHYLKYAHPVIQLSRNTQEIEAINWSPPFEGIQQIAPQDVPAYYKARRVWSQMLNDPKYTIERRLAPGEIVIFNNRRVLHSRNAFDASAGHRLLEGAYLGSDEWADKLRALKRKYAPGTTLHYGSGYVF